MSVSSGFEIEAFATVASPSGLALAPDGSTFGSSLYVASYGVGSANDSVFAVSAAGVVTPFASLDPEADPWKIEFPEPGSSFGDSLYVASNNLDGGQPLDCGGRIQRIDASGTVTDLTGITGCVGCGSNGVGLGEPIGMAFGPGDAFGTDLFVANSSDEPADIVRVAPNGALQDFVDDANCSFFAEGGFAPLDVAFGPGGSFGTDLYFTDYGDGCQCIYSATSSGVVGAPFVTLPLQPVALAFGRGDAFGTDLYAGAGDLIYRIAPDGTFSTLASGFAGALSLEFAQAGDALFVSDQLGNTVYRISAAVTAVHLPAPRERARLHPNAPNPFASTTTIQYRIPADGGDIALRVYDPAGRLVRTLLRGPQPGGDGAATWDGHHGDGRLMPAGSYFYRLEGDGFSESGKMLLIR